MSAPNQALHPTCPPSGGNAAELPRWPQRTTCVRAIVVLLLLATAAGCSSRDVYESTRSLRMQQCETLGRQERTQCEAQARQSHAESEKLREEAEAGTPQR
jgi:hypothetical protein